MPKVNWNDYDENKVASYSTVQPGNYLCRVKDIKVDRTRNDDEMWRLELIIEEQDNEFYGQRLFDNIVFSPKALNRAKLIFVKFGLDVSGTKDVQLEDLLDRYARVTVSHIETYTTSKGEKKEKSVIAFDGYDLATQADIKKEDDDIPF